MLKSLLAPCACLAVVLAADLACAQPLSTSGSDRAPAAAPESSWGSGKRKISQRRVSLKRLLDHSLEHAPAVIRARSGIAAGRAEVEAASPLLPSDPVLSGSVGRRQTNAGVGLDYSVGLEQEFDLAGKRGAAIDAARAELKGRRAELAAAQWFVHQRIHRAYHQAIVARDREAAARRVLAFAQRLLEISRTRLAAGETSPLPVRLAEAELAQAKQAAMFASSEYDRTRLELARTSGWPEPTLLTPSEKLHAPETPPAAAALLRRARKQQPALRAAQAREAAAEARLGAAERSVWPNPTLGVVYQNEAEPGGQPSRVIAATLSLPIPIWVGSAPEQARARAGIERARAERTALRTTLATEILQARQRVEANAQRARLYGTEILPTLEKNLELLQKAFELGEIDILQVMVAQERFLRTQQDALQSFADYYDAWAELEAIVGGELHEARRTGTAAENPETKP